MCEDLLLRDVGIAHAVGACAYRGIWQEAAVVEGMCPGLTWQVDLLNDL